MWFASKIGIRFLYMKPVLVSVFIRRGHPVGDPVFFGIFPFYVPVFYYLIIIKT